MKQKMKSADDDPDSAFLKFNELNDTDDFENNQGDSTRNNFKGGVAETEKLISRTNLDGAAVHDQKIPE